MVPRGRAAAAVVSLAVVTSAALRLLLSQQTWRHVDRACSAYGITLAAAAMIAASRLR